MDLVVSWLAFPFVLAVVSLGCGLLLDRLSPGTLERALVAPAGFALVVVVGGLATLTDATAELAAPAALALATAGFGLTFPSWRRRADGWAAAAAVAAFLAFGAPVFLSGEATFAGYIKLDDTATYLAIVDRIVEHGNDLAGLAPSTYEATLRTTVGIGYPVGSLVPLGVGASLVGVDPAWVFQPYLAFLGAMIALAAYSLARRLIRSRPGRAAAAFVAAQPAILYGFSLWGGIKELASAALIALIAALVSDERSTTSGVRQIAPLAVAAAALLGVLSVGGAVWVVPPAAFWLASAIRGRQGLGIGNVAAAGALTAVLALPVVIAAVVWVPKATSFTQDQLGNLFRPLSPLQIFGIWPTGDFRADPNGSVAAYVLVAVAAAAAVLGAAFAWTRRAMGLLVYVASGVFGCLLFAVVAAPWIESKAFATASPAFVLAAFAGAACLVARGRRVQGAAVAFAIAAGVLGSNALAYREVNLAPRAQLRELEAVGKRFAGQGPALMTEYQPYGVRHFLRELDPEGASELRRRPIPLANGRLLRKGLSADIDDVRLDAVLAYRTLVLRRSPVASRPPSPYRLAWRGRYYDVWQRDEPIDGTILAREPLGGPVDPAAHAPCRLVRRVAAAASPDGRVAAVTRPPLAVVEVSSAAPAPAVLARSGRYGVWLGGSFRRPVELFLNGRRVASTRPQLNHHGLFTPIGEIEAAAGRHGLAVRLRDEPLRPGSGGRPAPLGPLLLARSDDELAVRRVASGQARSLCGKRLDWLEAVKP